MTQILYLLQISPEQPTLIPALLPAWEKGVRSLSQGERVRVRGCSYGFFGGKGKNGLVRAMYSS